MSNVLENTWCKSVRCTGKQENEWRIQKTRCIIEKCFVNEWSRNNLSNKSDHTVVTMEKLFDALSVPMKKISFTKIILATLGLSKLEKYLISGTKTSEWITNEIIHAIILNAHGCFKTKHK